MMMESMPSRCRRCESISPAGPAPTIPTCVRIVSYPDWRLPYTGSAPRAQRGLASARPAVARHARLVVPVVLAKLGFEIALLAADHAEMEQQRRRKEQDRHPVGCQSGREPRQYEDGAHIHRIAKMGIDPGRRERERGSPRLHVGADLLE